MPHAIEPAASARAKCRACGAPIPAGVLRFGERLPNPFAEGEMTLWFHLECAVFRRPEPLLEALAQRTEPLEGRERLEAEARRGVEQHRLPRIAGAQRASSGRATCRHCREAIAKDGWRIPLVYFEEGRFTPGGFVHARCAGAYFETTDILARIRCFAPALSEEDLRALQAELEAA